MERIEYRKPEGFDNLDNNQFSNNDTSVNNIDDFQWFNEGFVEDMWHDISGAGNFLADLGSTALVSITSFASGAVDVVGDCGAAVIYGGGEFVAGIKDLTGDHEGALEFRDSVMQVGEDASNLGNYMQEALYNEENGLIKGVNDRSWLKYDSDTAHMMQWGGHMAAVIGLATWNPAVAAAVGGASGFGNDASDSYRTYMELEAKKILDEDSSKISLVSPEYITDGQILVNKLSLDDLNKIVGSEKRTEFRGKAFSQGLVTGALNGALSYGFGMALGKMSGAAYKAFGGGLAGRVGAGYANAHIGAANSAINHVMDVGIDGAFYGDLDFAYDRRGGNTGLAFAIFGGAFGAGAGGAVISKAKASNTVSKTSNEENINTLENEKLNSFDFESTNYERNNYSSESSFENKANGYNVSEVVNENTSTMNDGSVWHKDNKAGIKTTFENKYFSVDVNQ